MAVSKPMMSTIPFAVHTDDKALQHVTPQKVVHLARGRAERATGERAVDDDKGGDLDDEALDAHHKVRQQTRPPRLASGDRLWDVELRRVCNVLRQLHTPCIYIGRL